MRKIVFKNGTEIEVNQEVANILRDRILSGNAGNFQCFSDDANETRSIINISEIVCLGD
tara:strand:- start:289 stop:465 length:177 start_codon:yes stop_codon:yes gene_type:complete